MKKTVSSILLALILHPAAAVAQTRTIWHVTDTHVMSPKVCPVQGKAYDIYNFQEPQMDFHSVALFQAVIDSALTYRPDIMLLSGDLTKNGEKVSHETVAEMLKPVKENGTKVYVIPGNHDLHNPTGCIYDIETVRRSPGLSDDEFAALYGEYGYGEAVSRDRTTLSYAVYPSDELALLCIDANDWTTAVNNGTERPDTTERVSCAGSLSEETLLWMERQAALAGASGHRVFVALHQTLFHHFDKEKTLLASNLINADDSINDEGRLIQRFADMGVEVVFSGHRHFQDINYLTDSQDRKVWEINTGALVEQRPQYRICELTETELQVNTVVLRNVNLDGKGTSTDEYARQWFFSIKDQFLRALCIAAWPKVNEVLSTLPSFVKVLNLPDSYEKFYSLFDRYLADDVMQAYFIMAVGNEHFTDHSALIESIQAHVNAALLEICNNDEAIQKGVLMLLSVFAPDISFSTFAQDFFTSPLENYITANGGVVIDDDNCVIPLVNGAGMYVDGISTTDDAREGSDAYKSVYDLTGRKVDVRHTGRGIYSVAGRKYLKH